jgi:hypothetical protein
MKTSTKVILLVMLAIVTIIVIVSLKSQKSPVQAVGSVPTQVDNAKIFQDAIRDALAKAALRNQKAVSQFDLSLKNSSSVRGPELEKISRYAAVQLAEFKPCSTIIYYLALDQIKQGNQAENFVTKKIEPLFPPYTAAISQEINNATKTFEYEIQRSTVDLAYDLAAIKSDATHSTLISKDKLTGLNVDQSLRNLGFNATGVSVGIAFTATDLMASNTASALYKKISPIAMRIFGKQVAKVAVSGTLVAADGPLPIGDILALIGLAWTGYDVMNLQKEFEQEIYVSMNNSLQETLVNSQAGAVENMNKILIAHQTIQSSAGNQSLAQISLGNN